jgi:hypothetical protein
MSLRETMNKNPVVTGIVVIVLIAVGGWFCYSSLTARGGQGDMPKFYYYTVDEGKTLFSVSADEIPPIMKDGKEAVRARVYSCDDGKTTFAVYLEKYNETFKKQVEAAKAKPKDPNAKGPSALSGLLEGPAAAFAQLVKKPGDTTWLAGTSADGIKVMYMKCPSGRNQDLTEKLP